MVIINNNIVANATPEIDFEKVDTKCLRCVSDIDNYTPKDGEIIKYTGESNDKMIKGLDYIYVQSDNDWVLIKFKSDDTNTYLKCVNDLTTYKGQHGEIVKYTGDTNDLYIKGRDYVCEVIENDNPEFNTYVYHLINIASSTTQVQSDWEETDTESIAYIKNKPEIPDLTEYATKAELSNKANVSDLNLKANKTDLDEKADKIDLDNKADKSELLSKANYSDIIRDFNSLENKPTKLSDFENDLGDGLGTNNKLTLKYNDVAGTLELRSNNEVISSVSAEPFVKDGMIDSVVYEDNNLIITFNTDAGKQPITIPFDKNISQVNADWNEINTDSKAYIKNKPIIPSIEGLATEEYVDDSLSEIDEALKKVVNGEISVGKEYTAGDGIEISDDGVISIKNGEIYFTDDEEQKVVTKDGIKYTSVMPKQELGYVNEPYTSEKTGYFTYDVDEYSQVMIGGSINVDVIETEHGLALTDYNIGDQYINGNKTIEKTDVFPVNGIKTVEFNLAYYDGNVYLCHRVVENAATKSITLISPNGYMAYTPGPGRPTIEYRSNREFIKFYPNKVLNYNNDYFRISESIKYRTPKQPYPYQLWISELDNIKNTIEDVVKENTPTIPTKLSEFVDDLPKETSSLSMSTTKYVTSYAAKMYIDNKVKSYTGAKGIKVTTTTPYTSSISIDEEVVALKSDLKNYTAGNGININDSVISADTTVLATKKDLEGIPTWEDIPNPNLFATKEEVKLKANISDIPTLDGYATEEYVDNAIANAGGNSSETVSGKYLKIVDNLDTYKGTEGEIVKYGGATGTYIQGADYICKKSIKTTIPINTIKLTPTEGTSLKYSNSADSLVNIDIPNNIWCNNIFTKIPVLYNANGIDTSVDSIGVRSWNLNDDNYDPLLYAFTTLTPKIGDSIIVCKGYWKESEYSNIILKRCTITYISATYDTMIATDNANNNYTFTQGWSTDVIYDFDKYITENNHLLIRIPDETPENIINEFVNMEINICYDTTAKAMILLPNINTTDVYNMSNTNTQLVIGENDLSFELTDFCKRALNV